MSGTNSDGDQFTSLAGATLGTALTNLLLADDILPGTQPGYQLCKTIYVSHPLGAKMAEVPINMAMSQQREISVPSGPEERLVNAYWREWKSIGGVGADTLIHNAMRIARIYGISSVVCGTRGVDPSEPLQLDKLHEQELYFNVIDPLNSAGSLVLDQDPNSPNFQKPNVIRVANKVYHSSRGIVTMNEQPIYIEFTNSAFGYVGRSVYQRALYALKTFLQSMVTDQAITQKAGLLIWKAKAPGSIVNQRILNFFGLKRSQLKGGVTGNIVNISVEESIESLNFQNLEGPAKFARENALKNIAAAAGMPAVMMEQETLTSGFGEGTEDAKQIARYIERVRMDMNPLYSFFDQIVQRRAWSPDFYKTIQRDYPEQYKKIPYTTAFYDWQNNFQASWPNLLSEPESERMKAEEIRFKSITALVEVLSPLLDAGNRATLIDWAASEVNTRRDLFTAPLMLDIDALAEYVQPQLQQEPKSEPFSEAA